MGQSGAKLRFRCRYQIDSIEIYSITMLLALWFEQVEKENTSECSEVQPATYIATTLFDKTIKT